MSKRKIFILGLFLTLFVSIGIVTYAYFVKSVEGDIHGISSSPDDSKIVEVDTLNEFIQAVRLYDTLNSEFNSDLFVSNSSNRKTIKLTSSIRLLSNVLVDADCHINLNGFTLDLNGKTLTFKHHFEGVFAVYGGEIIDTTGQYVESDGALVEDEELVYGTILIDCPNSIVNMNDLTISEEVDITVTNASESQIVNAAMKMVFANIQNTGVNDFYSTTNVSDIVMDGCGFNHNSGTSCIYTYTDLDLIYNYFAYGGLTINYSSLNKNVLSDKGNVLSSGTTDLTVSVSYGETTLSKVLSVHVLESVDDYLKASNSIIINHLNKYYDTEKAKLLFQNSFLLPKTNTYLGTTYSYILTTANVDYEITSDSISDFFDTESYEGYYLVSLSKEITGIKVVSTKSTSALTSDAVELTGESTTLVDDNNSYVVNIVRELYGNQLFVRDGQMTFSTYTEFNILTDPTIKGYSRIKSISNTLINNEIEQTYTLIDYPEFDGEGNLIEHYGKYQLLRVDNTKVLPYIGQSVFLAITFNFVERYGSESITVQVPVIYEPADLGEGFDAFDPYFVYFDKAFVDVTNEYTYNSFSIPFTFDGYDPTYAFVIYQEDGTKLVDGELFTQSLSDGATYINYTKETLMNVTINPYRINMDDTKYYFAYVPAYKDALGNIYYYNKDADVPTTTDLSTIVIDLETYPYISELTIPGIVRYESDKSVVEEEFADKELYKISYELLNEDEYTEGKWILTSTLEEHIGIVDFSSDSELLDTYGYTLVFGSTDTDNCINSLKGINLLKGIDVLTFENTDLSTNALFPTEFAYIAELENMKVLHLGNTKIYDQTANSTTTFPQGENNGFLLTLSSLNNLEELYLNNNQIYSFEALSEFASLKKVDVSYNSFTHTSEGFSIGSLLIGIVNTLYGTHGVTNIAVLLTLETSGATVIKDSEGSGDLDENFVAIVNAITSLEYQDRLKKGISMADTIFKAYLTGTGSTVCTTYGISNSFSIDSGDNTVEFKFNSISFVEVDDGEAFEIQAKYDWIARNGWGWEVDSNSIIFKYKYKVSRY